MLTVHANPVLTGKCSVTCTSVVGHIHGLDFAEYTGLDPGNLYAFRAVRRHPNGGQFDFVWLPARLPYGAYVWCGRTCG